jgi:hypothetical protein
LNYFDSYVDIFIDTTQPVITHNPVASVFNDTNITITANVVDASSGIESVILYFKKPSDSTYITSTMEPDGDNYTTYISASSMTEEGLEYYIKATDKSSPHFVVYYGYNGQTTTEPSSLTDMNIELILADYSPPVINHIPVTKSTVGANITISAIVTDASSIDYVELYYKKKTDGVYTKVSMSKSEDVYSAEIPGNKATLDGIEYYIKAKDNAQTPHIIFFGASDHVSTEPGTSNDIDITIENILLPNAVAHTPTGNNVPLESTITLTFNKAMDHESTENAFLITPDISGHFSWDDDTNKLIFIPDINLNYSTTYTVTLVTTALDNKGNSLVDNYQWNFKTINNPEDESSQSFWDTWEPIITGATVLASIIVFLIGFLSIRRKRGKLRLYMERIENTFDEHKNNPEECKKELIALRDSIKADVKKGKIEENHFLILDKKIDDHLMELKVMEKEGIGVIPEEDIVSEELGEEG